ncbi:unnamed protein product [Taenia asiatica]|uniref:Uncharacterized protein n=1 Tax=Taenia asiatica TaxID=60517 RepID=A0A3P6NJJ3_TAEAS|nr:unnamed protein product [Taenia asiatica]
MEHPSNWFQCSFEYLASDVVKIGGELNKLQGGVTIEQVDTLPNARLVQLMEKARKPDASKKQVNNALDCLSDSLSLYP